MLRSFFTAICGFGLLGACTLTFGQTAPAADGGSRSISAPNGASSAATVSTTQAEAKPAPHVPHPPIHVIRLPQAGASPVAPLAIPGAHADYFGGPVLSNVHIVAVLYGTGSYLPNIAGTATPTLAQFYTDITQSSYFDLLNEYSTVGVTATGGAAGSNQTIGHGFFDGQFTITPSATNNGATISDAQIQSELLAQVSAGKLPAPVFDSQGNNNTLYMIFFPPGKTITAGGATSCVQGGFCAYHNSTTGSFASHRLFYGVHPDLQPPSGCSQGCGGNFIIFDNVTTVTSHELSEAVTDPDVGPATSLGPPLAWIDPINSEIGDICVGLGATVSANSTPYEVQREFSDFQNDCVAGPPQVFVADAGQTVSPGQQFDLQVSVQSADNANLTGYNGTLHFTSSDAKAILPADYTFNFADAGTHTFVASLGTPGAQTISITDTKQPLLSALNRPFNVVTSPVSRFSIAGPGNVTQGVGFSVFVAARDSNNEIVSGYSGTVHFTSSDTSALLPANATLTNGVGTFPVTLNTVSGQSMNVADTTNGQIFGETNFGVFAASPNPSSTAISSSLNPSTFFQPVTYTATVTQGGSPATVGTVTFTVDGFPITSAQVDATGQAQAAISNLQGGAHVIFADYIGGDPAHPPSSSGPLHAVVNPAATTVTLTSTSPTAAFGSIVFLSAQLSSPAVPPSGGFVTFFDGGTPLAVIAPNFGIASLRDTSLPVGSHTITASYSGTSSFAASTATPFTQVITPAPATDYSLTPDRNSATVSAGQSANFLITIQSVSGFTGNVNFRCANLPALTTCSFNPIIAFVSPLSPTLTARLTVKTSGPHAMLLHPLQKPAWNARLWVFTPFAFGLMLLASSGGKSRTRMLAILLAVTLLAGIVSCGGGGSTPPPPPPQQSATPAGTTTITVTAAGTPTSGTGPANPSQNLNLQLTVLQ